MLTAIRKEGPFHVREVWFASSPHIDQLDGGGSGVVFMDCLSPASWLESYRTMTLVIDLTKSLDEIWNGMSQKSCRYEIKRSEREGVLAGMSHDVETFCEINTAFRRAKGLKGGVSPEYISEYGTLFMASINGEWVAGQVYLRDNHTMRWLLGASRRLETRSPLIGCANRRLIWEAIKFAKANGLCEFDFGGYYMGGDPQLLAVNFFKDSFGGEVVDRYVCRRDLSPAYYVARRVYERVSRWT